MSDYRVQTIVITCVLEKTSKTSAKKNTKAQSLTYIYVRLHEYTQFKQATIRENKEMRSGTKVSGFQFKIIT